MGIVRRFAVDGLDEAARRNRRQAGMRVGALDETGQEKQGRSTAASSASTSGCAGRSPTASTPFDLSYVRQGTGHALIGAGRGDPGSRSPIRAVAGHGTAAGPAVRTKGQLAIRRLRRRVR